MHVSRSFTWWTGARRRTLHLYCQILGKLRHRYITRFYEFINNAEGAVLVMEFVEGRTLAEFLATGRRPTPVQASEIAEKIVAAIRKDGVKAVTTVRKAPSKSSLVRREKAKIAADKPKNSSRPVKKSATKKPVAKKTPAKTTAVKASDATQAATDTAKSTASAAKSTANKAANSAASATA